MKNTSLVACILFATQLIYSQESNLASGGDALGTGGSSSYSVGQLFYTTITSNDGTVIQGMQQNLELFTLSNAELTTVQLKAVMYPNPTTDYIVLALTDANLTDLSYAMYDIHGRVLTKGLVTNENTQIGMQGLATGIYILKVNQNNNKLKFFKIIKN